MIASRNARTYNYSQIGHVTYFNTPGIHSGDIDVVAGNVATEDVVYLLEGLGIGCAVSLDKLVTITDSLSQRLGHPPASRVARAQLAKRH